MTAVVGMPTTPEVDDPHAGTVNMSWVGQIVRAEGEIHVDDPFIPEIFGRMLVDTYWELGANIEAWWEQFVNGEHFTTDVTPDSDDANWVYVGTARFLVVFHYDGTRWVMAQSLWSDDPAAAVYHAV